MRREIHVFFTALMFYTRIPCPSWVNHDPEYLNLSTRYFPLVGLLVGVVASLAMGLSLSIFSETIAVLLGLAVSLLTTGAFHEDGLADVMDGFGGGWNKEKILDIMKDSRVGTFGVAGLVVVLGLKVGALSHGLTQQVWPTLLFSIFAHGVSRCFALSTMYLIPYAQEDALSKAKPIATQPSTTNMVVGWGWMLPWALFVPAAWWLTLPVAAVVWLWVVRMSKKWIGGYTGDVLGSIQQLTEVSLLLSYVALWNWF
jgi:adenosylcobinamide-GDP ribazoletransferase